MTSIREIKEAVEHRAKEYGAERVYLFGSYANGSATDDSDVDLRIDKGRIRGIELASMMLDLEDDLNVSVDLITTGSLSDKFLNSIKDEEQLIYGAI